jgi:O-antigen/teichoic acid export membrane protein
MYFILIARSLGVEEFGKFASITAIGTIFMPFSTWGSGNILVKHVSRNKGHFSEYWGESYLVTWISSLLLSIVAILLSMIFIPGVGVLSICFFIIGDIVFSRLLDICIMAFLAFEDYKTMAMLQIAPSLLLSLSSLSLFLLPAPNGLLRWSVLYFVCFAFGAALGLMSVFTKLGWGRMKFQRLRQEFVEGFYFSVSVSSQSVYNDIDKVLLTQYAGPSSAGLYSAAYRIINVLFIPINALMYSAYPRFFREGQSGLSASFKWARRLIKFSLIYVVCSFILLFFGAPLITQILGSGYELTSVVVLWLSPLILLKVTHNFFADALTGAGFQKERCFVQVFVAIFNLLLNVILIARFGWKGAAISSILSDGLLALCFVLVIFMKLEMMNRVEGSSAQL